MDRRVRSNRNERRLSRLPICKPWAVAGGSVRILFLLLIWLAAIVTLSAACGPLPLAQPSATPEGKSYRSPAGLEITPLEVQPDDVAQVLGVERWKFQVELPGPGVELRFQLELRRPGEQPQVLDSLIVQLEGTSETEALVGIHPIHESIFGANQIKLFIDGGGGSTTGLIENPLQEYSFSSSSVPAELQADGTFELMALSNEGHIPSPDNAVLVFSIEIVNN